MALLPKDDPSLRDQTPETIAKITLDDVKGYMASAMRPDLTTIVIVGDITPEEARALLPGRLLLTARGDPRGLPGIEAASGTATPDGWTDWNVTLSPGAASGALLEACTAGGFPLRRFETHRPSLHEVFLHVVGDREVRT